MQEMKVKLTFNEGILGTNPGNKELWQTYINSKGPDAKTREEEIAEYGAEEVANKGITVFNHLEDGTPFFYDYQIKGFMKSTCGFLRKVPKKKSASLKAYKKEIDGLIFIEERYIPIITDQPITYCERPLRAQTAQGERVSIAVSEEIAPGATIEFTVECLVDSDMDLVREWLDYGKKSGIGQWRNSGKGRFTWEEIRSEKETKETNTKKTA